MKPIKNIARIHVDTNEKFLLVISTRNLYILHKALIAVKKYLINKYSGGKRWN
jgi:hypothetical protein